ncbi:hypothetical protein, partial [Pseudomonas viridiflava]|uniref:hypothetical protein n=1 Tax=Pseudomonas viridiflava TaxID=33069 RepID=UPI001E584078
NLRQKSGRWRFPTTYNVLVILLRGRRPAGDAVDAACQENRVIVHRRQAASHGSVFAARQRYVEDV